MIQLHKFLPAWGHPDLSPFCVKVEAYLRMTGTEFESCSADARKAPKQKLPYITDGTHTVADSRDIIAYLEAKSAAPVDAGISKQDAALSVAYRGVLEEELYFLMLNQRWRLDEGWTRLAPTMLAYGAAIGVPGLVRPMVVRMVRRKVIGTAIGHGSGRHSAEELDARACEIIDAVATQLGDGPYFLGARPRVIDCTVFAFMLAGMAAPFTHRAKAHLENQPNIVAYVERMRAEIFDFNASQSATQLRAAQ